VSNSAMPGPAGPSGHSGERAIRTPPASAFDPRTIERPDELLLRYYTIQSLFGLIFFPIIFIPLWIRYTTLRYRFDDEGVGMSVGLLFKRETYLTYRRIQDIHVSRGLIQRWIGLTTVSIQTASGSSTPELTIEGIRNPDELRDWLYRRMRGSGAGQEHVDRSSAPAGAPASPNLGNGASLAGTTPGSSPDDEVLALLHEIRDELRSLRSARAERTS